MKTFYTSLLVFGAFCLYAFWESLMKAESKGPQRSVAEQSCEVWTSSKQNLQLVQADIIPENPAPAQVQFELQKDVLVVFFDVQSPEIFAANPMPKDRYPYQYDVVELFVSVGGSKNNFPYYEFEVSPYNQTFQVLLEFKGGKKHSTSPIDMGLESKATITPTGWTAEMRIPLKNLAWTGKPEDIIGNAFTIIGEGKKRAYWSLFLKPQVKAHFHVPEQFKNLLSCQGPA